ncbi:MAG: M1 family aminopeptidase [bacterium]
MKSRKIRRHPAFRVFILIALTIPVPSIIARPEQPDSSLRPAAERLAKSAQLAMLPEISQQDSLHPWDELHLDIHLSVSILPADSAEMEVVQVATPLSPGQQEYLFNLGPSSVRSLEVNGAGASWVANGDEITVQLPTPAEAGDTVRIRTAYRVPIHSNNYAGGLVYDFSSDVLYTHGEPYTTRWWVSCHDFPGDKVTSTVTTVLPPAYRVLSNGALELDSLGSDGLRITTWNNDDPISTYLISIAAHPYAVIDAGVAGIDDVEVHYWVYPNKEAAQTFDFGRTPEMIDFFESRFGPYPFNKYDQAVAPIFNGNGAMENQTATTFGQNIVGNGTRRFEGVVAHELAHQWWGDHVSPKTFSSIWLNEGFASYGEVLWAEHLGADTMVSVLASQQTSYFHEVGEGVRIALDDPPEKYLFSSTVYDKGSRVLHMLRYLIGDSLFFEGLQQYGQAFAYGNAETADFQNAMEIASGKDLSDFFDEWVRQAGYPVYAFSRFDVEESASGWTASVQLNQTQTKTPFYTLPLPLQFTDADEDTLVRVPVQALAEQVLSVSGLPFRPLRLEFDPEGWVLARYNLSSIGGPSTVATFDLSPAWPNPFNRETHVDLVLYRPSHLTVEVFNILGQSVDVLANGGYQPGLHRFVWRAADGRSSGVYLLRVESVDQQTSRRVVLLR